MGKTRNFFEDKLAKKLLEDPTYMVSSGLRSQNIKVCVDGPDGGEWLLSFDESGNSSLAGAAESKNVASHCEIQTTDKTFEGLLAGTVNVPMAFLMKKIKVKGESSLALKLGLALQKKFL